MPSAATPEQHPDTLLHSAQQRFMAERLRRMDARALRRFCDEYLPLDLCRQYGLVPLGHGGHFCTIGACNPRMVGLWNCVDRLEAAGLIVRLERIPAAVYEEVMHRLQSPPEVGADTTGAGSAPLPNSSSVISSDSILALTQELAQEPSLEDDTEDPQENAPVVRLLHNLIAQALQRGVSDIHIEPQEDHCRVRLRQDGMLQTVANLPAASLDPLIARVKVMAKLNIAERRLPQDGATRFEQGGRSIDIRVSTLPGRFGEKAVLRILTASNISLDLETLIPEPRERELLRSVARRPYGIIVVSGPTGSGKTTTLYALLRERNQPGINILTVEDPVEYTLPGIHQVQIIREKGYDFARALRAFMRQDPDLILVGETRDRETARTAVEASLTGHLVLTTLHANDALTSIPRLTEMGVEPYLLASSLLAICAQRLVRRLCPGCSDWHDYTPDETAEIGLPEGGRFRRAHELSGPELQAATQNGTLCPVCGGLGYSGRLGVFEVVRIDDTLRNLIVAQAPLAQLQAAAHAQGMRSLLTYGVGLLHQGLTSVEELQRVCLSL